MSKVIFQQPPLATPGELRRSPSPKPAGTTTINMHPCDEIPIPIGRDSPAMRRHGRDDKRLLNTHIKRQSKARGKVFQDKMATPSGKEKPNP